MFDRILWWLGIVAFISMCITIILVLTGWSPAPPGLGDVFTFGSILVAAIIAYIGWKRAEKNQSDAWKRVDENQRKIWNREDEKRKEANNRDAAVQAIILYRQMIPTIRTVWRILEAAAHAEHRVTAVGERVAHYEALNIIFNDFLNVIGPSLSPQQAVPLLKNDVTLGEAYLNVIECREIFVEYLRSFKRFSKHLNPEAGSQIDKRILGGLLPKGIALLYVIELLSEKLKYSEGEVSLVSRQMDVIIARDAVDIAETITQSKIEFESTAEDQGDAMYKSALSTLYKYQEGLFSNRE